jgi:hypothetical protein
MARPATSPAARIGQLEAAAKRAKALKRGERLSAKPMADLIGVGWPTLRGWCNDIPKFAESGSFEGGGNGIEYSFAAAKTIRFLIGHFTAQRDAGRKRARRLRQIAGPALDAMSDDIDLDELRKLLALSTSLQEAKLKSGDLTERSRVAAALREVFTTMQQAGLKAIQQADPTGQLPPETRRTLEDVMRSVLLAQERAAQDCLRGLNGSAAQPG